jgi:hypothetical protein
LNKEVTVRFGKLKMQLWDSMTDHMSTQYRLVQSGKTASGGCSDGQGSSELQRHGFLIYYIENLIKLFLI